MLPSHRFSSWRETPTYPGATLKRCLSGDSRGSKGWLLSNPTIRKSKHFVDDGRLVSSFIKNVIGYLHFAGCELRL